jgi:hypothetical protein
MLLWAFGEFAGWEYALGIIVFGIYIAAVAIAVIALVLRARPATRPLADKLGWHRPIPGTRWIVPAAGMFFVAMVLALFGGMIANAAFAYRYASIVFPPVALLVALGIVAIGRSRLGVVVGSGLLAAVALVGAGAGVTEVRSPRTQAVAVAAQISANARPGDVIAFCPDQLGPAVSRLLPSRLYVQVTFPRFDDPARINWVDYAAANEAENPAIFARQLLNLAGEHQVWLVWEAGYRTMGQSCEELRNTLRIARPDWNVPVRSQPSYYEHENLIRFLPQ